jgi:hypothetical protein
MRAAKARGEIDRFPNGGRAKALPPLSKDRKIRKAQRIIENEMARRKKQQLLVPPPKPWVDLTRGEKLERAADAALDRAWEVLQWQPAPTDLKLSTLVSNVALTILARQIGVEAAQADQSHPVPTGLSRSEAIALMNAADRLDALLTLPPAADEEDVIDAAGS